MAPWICMDRSSPGGEGAAARGEVDAHAAPVAGRSEAPARSRSTCSQRGYVESTPSPSGTASPDSGPRNAWSAYQARRPR